MWMQTYRPTCYEDVIGQTDVVRLLRSHVLAKQFHAVYLLKGPHGTGKTTLARLFAMSVMCYDGITDYPCQQCPACLGIQRQDHACIDYREIDGASHTKVDDVRALLETLLYPPSHAPYKVCLIDEVHMLSDHSFNALLKTLEEPPSHVIMLLATTDDVPKTVLSRCLRLQLDTLSVAQMVPSLEKIALEHHLAYTAEDLTHIAQKGHGSMRDALNWMQYIVSIQHTLCNSAPLLGIASSDLTHAILAAIMHGDQPALLAALQAVPDRLAASCLQGVTERLCRMMVNRYHHVPDPLDVADVPLPVLHAWYTLLIKTKTLDHPSERMALDMTCLHLLLFHHEHYAQSATLLSLFKDTMLHE
jgi:DNA polymerase III subunit gamma/tau